MTELVNGMSNMMMGQSSVPTSSDVMGPLQGSNGLVGQNGKVDYTKLASFGSTLASASLSYFGDKANNDAKNMGLDTQAQALSIQSKEMRIQAKQEELAAKEEGIDVLKRLKKTISGQNLASGGNMSGSAYALMKQSYSDAGDDLYAVKESGNARVLQRRRKALEYMRQRSSVLSQKTNSSELSGSMSTLSGYMERQVQRG